MLAELEDLLDAINTQIQFYKDSFADRPESNYLKIQDVNGAYLVSPLLIAKAQCITAILALKKEMQENSDKFICEICGQPIHYYPGTKALIHIDGIQSYDHVAKLKTRL